MVTFKLLEFEFVLKFEILLYRLMLHTEANDKIKEIEKAILEHHKC